VRAAGPILPALPALVSRAHVPPEPGSAARGSAWLRLAALGLALGLALCGGAPTHAAAEPLAGLAGPLRQLAPAGVVRGVVGSFALVSSGGDLRSEPGLLEIAMPAGSLRAESLDPPVLHGVHRIDPFTGRPLRADAPDGARCPTGAEPDCWQAGDPLPGSNDTAVAWCLASLDDPLGYCPVTTPPYPFWTGDEPSPEWFAAGVTPPAWPFVGLPGSSGRAPTDATPVSPGTSLPGETELFCWNLVDCLVQLSVGGPGYTDGAAFDPTAPYSTAWGQCSFVQPQYCSEVRAFFGQSTRSTTLLPDDPSGPPLTRFLWEAGADYRIVEAGGVLAPFDGGIAHVLGVEGSRIPGMQVGVPIVLVAPGATEAGVMERAPEPGSLPGAPAASDAAAPAGDPCTPDPVVPAPCDAPLVFAHGAALVYATAPEPGPGALAAVALLALGRLAASRARRRAARPPLTPPGAVW
jgi:hypothetical protein